MKTIVVGGGASGLMSAYASASKGNQVVLLEKNEKLGKKIYITGKGRCNLTNNVSVNDFMNNVVSNPKFLYSALNSFSPEKTYEFFENNGLKLKVERGNRVFPQSDKASDVTKCLEKVLLANNVDFRLGVEVKEILVKNGKVFGVKTDKSTIECDNVIIATGGVSYPLTGSTGDGLRFASTLGHNITDLKPALVGLDLVGEDYKDLQGLSLKNVNLTVKNGNKTIYSDFGEMLFTHFGISGPIVLSCSSVINRQKLSDLKLYIDLKPALSVELLDQRLIRELSLCPIKSIYNVMPSLLPKSMIDLILTRAELNGRKKCSEITKVERQALINVLKNLEFSIKNLRPIEEAIVTSGGVSVKEINPKTMESKLIKGLFFAGEVLDVDAFTGGFNLQIAFSTGYLAGISTASNC